MAPAVLHGRRGVGGSGEDTEARSGRARPTPVVKVGASSILKALELQCLMRKMNQEMVKQSVDTGRPLADYVRPEFVRLPRAGARCPISGLGRTMMWELIKGPHPKVKSVALRQPGATRGVRLVAVSSLLEFLNSQATDEEMENGKKRTIQCPEK